MRARFARAIAPMLMTVATLSAASPTASPDAPRADFDAVVVGLSVTFQRWDEDRPWAKAKPETRRVSAVVIGPNRMLTTADSLDFATFIQVSTFGRTRQVGARIDRVDRSVNLALISFADPSAAGDLQPVAVAPRTPASGTLRTARWRGQQLEVAASRVIRIEVERSLSSNVQHAVLRMRTDLAGGGWAEPVFSGDALVGITTSQSGDESRAIPAEILSGFLADAAAGTPVRGFATLGVNWQVNRDSAVSRFLGQQDEPKGVLVRQVPWGSSGCGVLKPRDILLELGGESLEPEGYYRHPWLGRLGFNEILAERFHPGDVVPVRVLRDGRELELTLTARSYPASLNLVPNTRSGPPPYLIVGGFVIRELDGPYLRTWGKEWEKTAPRSLLSRSQFGEGAQTPDRRRIVLIASVLPASYNIGYQDLHDVVIERVNGRPIGRIEDVVAALETPDHGYQVFDLSPESARDRIVLDAATLDAATAEILDAYGKPPAQRPREEPLAEGGGDCPGDF